MTEEQKEPMNKEDERQEGARSASPGGMEQDKAKTSASEASSASEGQARQTAPRQPQGQGKGIPSHHGQTAKGQSGIRKGESGSQRAENVNPQSVNRNQQSAGRDPQGQAAQGGKQSGQQGREAAEKADKQGVDQQPGYAQMVVTTGHGQFKGKSGKGGTYHHPNRGDNQAQGSNQAKAGASSHPASGGRWIDLGSKPQPASGPATQGQPRPSGTTRVAPQRPATTPTPHPPAGHTQAPGQKPAGTQPVPSRPAGPAPQPTDKGKAAVPVDTKAWIRPKTDSRRARGIKKERLEALPAEAEEEAPRKALPTKARLPLKPRPVPLKLQAKEVAKPVPKPAPAPESAAEAEKAISLPHLLTVRELADALEVSAVDVIKSLMQNGIMASINQTIDFDTAAIVAADLGFDVKPMPSPAPEAVTEAEAPVPDRRHLLAAEDEAQLVPRPPVVTVMGHVDHGKTSLLDAIRETNVIATEAGGITQHIGAYQVEKNGHKITFLDTPGHEAFTAMRARGAQVTDIAVLVVAADDGVQPQTLEALNHARAAKVPIIVALNKIDKENANPELVKKQLSEAGLVVEEWGGDTVCVPVSAKKKIGIDQLLEMILLVAEMQELKANPNRPAVGTIIEARLDKAKGPLATVLVQQGTLKVGDNVVVGSIYGKVKAMFNDKGKRVRKAEPATPVEILGLTEAPQAGDILEVVPDEKTARALAQERQEKQQAMAAAPSTKVSLDDLFAQIQAGKVKELNIILKADVQGSLEPIVNSLNKLGDEKVKVKVIHQGIGAITESDIALAVASGAIVIGFNQRPDQAAKSLAEKEGVDVRFYDVIYNLVDDVQKALQGLYEPKFQEVLEGKAEVRAVFKVGKDGAVAGCYVLEGLINRGALAKVVRNGEVIATTKIASLRRFKEDVKEVQQGYECGIGLEEFTAFQEKDIIETYRKERVS